MERGLRRPAARPGALDPTLQSVQRIALSNGFDSALVLDQITEAKADLMSFDGCLGSCMTGSGSAVFGLFADMEKHKGPAYAFNYADKTITAGGVTCALHPEEAAS